MIPYSKPYLAKTSIANAMESIKSGHLQGDGLFTKKCSESLSKQLNTDKILLTTSCSSALDMAALLCNLENGDEVIMPSYTFSSTANAFLAQKCKIVFADVDAKTLNITADYIAEKITSKTRVIVVVHYAGVPCIMDPIIKLAEQHNLILVEDAAQAIASSYDGKPAGTMGNFGCLSFHATKNIAAGEAGAIILRSNSQLMKAEYIREKGTNRTEFVKGQKNKYEWVSQGSSYLPSDIISALLYSQLKEIAAITSRRLSLWNQYYEAFKPIESKYGFHLNNIPDKCSHNGHIFYLILDDIKRRKQILQTLHSNNIGASSHYEPLHLSPLWRKLNPECLPKLKNTEFASPRIIRLPIWHDMEEEQATVIENVLNALEKF